MRRNADSRTISHERCLRRSNSEHIGCDSVRSYRTCQSGFSLMTHYHSLRKSTFPSRCRSAVWSVPAQQWFSQQVKEHLAVPQYFQTFSFDLLPAMQWDARQDQRYPFGARWDEVRHPPLFCAYTRATARQNSCGSDYSISRCPGAGEGDRKKTWASTNSP